MELILHPVILKADETALPVAAHICQNICAVHTVDRAVSARFISRLLPGAVDGRILGGFLDAVCASWGCSEYRIKMLGGFLVSAQEDLDRYRCFPFWHAGNLGWAVCMAGGTSCPKRQINPIIMDNISQLPFQPACSLRSCSANGS